MNDSRLYDNGYSPPFQGSEAAQPSRPASKPAYTAAWWLGSAGVLLVAIRLILPAIPGVIFSHTSLNTALGVCNSPLGAMAQSLGGGQVQSACNTVNTVNAVLWAGFVAGLLLVAAAVFSAFRAKTRFEAPPRRDWGVPLS